MLSRVSPGLKCPNQTPSTFLFTFAVSQAAALVTWDLTWAGDRPVMVRDTSVITPTSHEATSVFEDIHQCMRYESTFCVC